jgi:hypothetical protein
MSAEAAAPQAPTRIRGRKRGALLSLIVSGGLIYLLYRTLNLRQVGEALLSADRLWLVISIGMILPITGAAGDSLLLGRAGRRPAGHW